MLTVHKIAAPDMLRARSAHQLSDFKAKTPSFETPRSLSPKSDSDDEDRCCGAVGVQTIDGTAPNELCRNPRLLGKKTSAYLRIENHLSLENLRIPAFRKHGICAGSPAMSRSGNWSNKPRPSESGPVPPRSAREFAMGRQCPTRRTYTQRKITTTGWWFGTLLILVNHKYMVNIRKYMVNIWNCMNFHMFGMS